MSFVFAFKIVKNNNLKNNNLFITPVFFISYKLDEKEDDL